MVRLSSLLPPHSVKEPTSLFSVANLYGLWDWVGMAPHPVRAHSLWAGVCPEKLANK